MGIFNTINTGLMSKLSGSTALVTALGGTAVYYNDVPAGVSLPYVVFNVQAGGPENITPQDIRQAVVFVRAYASNPAQAGTIDGIVENLLHGGSVTLSGYNTFWTVRENDVEAVQPYPEDGSRVYAVGGFYRIRFSK